MDFTLIATGIAIGLSMTAPLGPVNIIVICTALRRGLWVAVLTGVGAVLADLIFAVGAAYGVRAIERLVIDYAAPLTLTGGAVLVVMGIRIARYHISLGALEAQEAPSRRQIMTKMLTTFGLTLTNPGTFIGFIAIFGAMSGVLKLGSAPYRPLFAVMGVALGGIAWWLFLSYIVTHFRAHIGTTMLDRINRWTGILIAAFGFALLMGAVF